MPDNVPEKEEDGAEDGVECCYEVDAFANEGVSDVSRKKEKEKGKQTTFFLPVVGWGVFVWGVQRPYIVAAHRGTSFAQGPERAQGAGVRKEERGRGGSEEIGDNRVSQLVTATASPLGHRLMTRVLDVRRSS